MCAVPVQPSAESIENDVERQSSNSDWVRIGAGSTLLAGSLLLLGGKRRAGLIVTVAGAALALLDQKETVKACWDALPGYLDKTQHMLEEAQSTLDDIAAKRDKLMSLLNR